jgi:hypothetical protein
MAEYSQFQVPNVAPIDWGKITEGIVEKLDKTEKEREGKRVALDKEYTDVVQKIDSFQGSKAPTFNQFIMNGANDIRDYLYEQNKLLKSGKIKPSDYSRVVSTVSDGWGRLADLTKGYDANFEEGMKRVQEGKAGAQEMYQRQLTAELMNLKDKRTFINPNDGRLYIAKVNKDGGVDGEANLFDVQTLNAGLNQNVDKLILSNEVEKYTKTLGREARMVNGRYVTSEEIRKGFEEKTKPKIIASIISDPNKAASVLTDNIDEGYVLEQNESFFTSREIDINKLAKMRGESKNEKEKKAIQAEINRISGELNKTILLKRDENNIYTPILTEAQQKKAKEVVGDVIKSQLDYMVEKPETQSAPRETTYDKKEAKEQDLANKRIKQVNEIYTERERPSDRSIGYIRGADAGSISESLAGYEVETLIAPKGTNDKIIRLRKRNIDKKTGQFIGFSKPLDYLMPKEEEGYKNIINKLMNQKTGKTFAWPDIDPGVNTGVQSGNTRVGLFN